MKKLSLLFIVVCTVYAFFMAEAFAYRIVVDVNGDAHKWEPGADTESTFDPGPSRQNGPGTPGGATSSIMAPLHNNFLFDHHPAGAQSVDFFSVLNDPVEFPDGSFFTSHFPDSGDGVSRINAAQAAIWPDLSEGVPVPYELLAIDWALDTWAEVSGFTNLGPVPDGDGGTADNSAPPDFPTWNGNGATDANGGNEGDIRIAAFDAFTDGILAESFQPGTDGPGNFAGNIGGDAHFAINNGVAGIPGFHWLNDENHSLDGVNGVPNGYDFLTNILHEMGHALGLGHRTEDPRYRPGPDGVIMDLYAQRRTAMRYLTADDIDGIQAIYGAADPGDVDTTPPSCELTAEIPGPPPPVSIEITTQDDESGLYAINVLVADNAMVTVPPFTEGTNDPVVITAESVDQDAESTVQLEITDVADNVKDCEYIFNKQEPQTTVINDELGLSGMTTVFDNTPQPNAPAGVFTISATFSNVSASEITEMFFEVASLTGGNLVLNADGGPGGVGAIVSVLPANLGPNGILDPGESFTIDFQIGLATLAPFSFFVDAFGIAP